jgi:hypothetical protein
MAEEHTIDSRGVPSSHSSPARLDRYAIKHTKSRNRETTEEKIHYGANYRAIHYHHQHHQTNPYHVPLRQPLLPRQLNLPLPLPLHYHHNTPHRSAAHSRQCSPQPTVQQRTLKAAPCRRRQPAPGRPTRPARRSRRPRPRAPGPRRRWLWRCRLFVFLRAVVRVS